MKNKNIASLLFTAALLGSAARADVLHLRYEWSASPAGPYGPVPPDLLKVHDDGTASVATAGPRGFFRLLINDNDAGGGATVPVQALDALPKTTLFAVRELLGAVAADGSAEGAGWKGATLSPFVTPVTSAWNDTGVPDMVEIKIHAPCDAPLPGSVFRNEEGGPSSPEHGFILAGVSRKVPPIVGYSTTGMTPTESLLRQCDGGKVRTIIRFGPMFLGALDDDGRLLANRGLLPVLYPDQAYRDRSAPVSHTADSEVSNNPRMPDPPPAATPRTFTSFGQLLTAYRTTPFLIERRLNTERLIDFDWQTLEGDVPTLSVRVGERLRFLEGDTYRRYWLDDEDTARPAGIVLGREGEGLEITGGTTVGAYRLRLEGRSAGNPCNHPQPFLLVVRPAVAVRDNPALAWVTTSKVWEAGTEAQQPRFSQRSDLERWCDSVGCGPVMLALMIASTEQNRDVPGAYWNRTTPSQTLRRASVRNIDSPSHYTTDDPAGTMQAWYDWLHDQCNVACWDFNGSGSAVPWDVGSTMEQYHGQATSPLYLPLLLVDPGTSYVKGSWHWENDVWGDDWDEAGIRVAESIKAGRPGGVYYMEHWHYAVAWRYRKTTYEYKIGNVVLKTKIARHFRVNTGWGASDEHKDAVWNAYDIDGCYLLNLSQRRLPPVP